jgi:hypothetical protein
MPHIVREANTHVRNLINYLQEVGFDEAETTVPAWGLRIWQFKFTAPPQGYIIYARRHSTSVELFRFGVWGHLQSHKTVEGIFRQIGQIPNGA